MDVIQAYLKYEIYFLTKMGFELGDSKWLLKNPIKLNTDHKSLYANYMKLFKRVFKLYVARNLPECTFKLRFLKNSISAVCSHDALLYLLKSMMRNGQGSKQHIEKLSELNTLIRSNDMGVTTRYASGKQYADIYMCLYQGIMRYRVIRVTNISENLDINVPIINSMTYIQKISEIFKKAVSLYDEDMTEITNIYNSVKIPEDPKIDVKYHDRDTLEFLGDFIQYIITKEDNVK